MIEMSDIRPVNGFILLKFKRTPQEVALKSGLFIPSQNVVSHVWIHAQVIALDPRGFMSRDRSRRPHEVKVGDWVLIERIFGTIVEDGEVRDIDYKVVSEDQITAVIEGEVDDHLWFEV
jgi:co-chaperonin GroES (HSP10)